MSVLMITDEIWLPVPEWELFEVSNLGRVRSLRSGRLMHQQKNRCGYFQVLFSCLPERRKLKYVHQLVAAAFIGERLPGFQTNHKDGIKTNNHASNLEYVTQSANAKHALALGLQQILHGERRGHAKLRDSDIPYIRHLLAIGMSQPEIAKIFAVSRGTIGDIHRNKKWRHV